MSLKDKALIHIQNGEWIFDLVGPLFREGLLTRIGRSEASLPMMELTLRAYGMSRLGMPLLPRVGRFVELEAIDSYAQNTLSKLANSIFTKAVPKPLNEKSKNLIFEAECFLAENAVHTRNLHERWITSYLLLENVTFRSASSPHAFGCIFFGESMERLDYKNLAVSIVHEMAHQELFVFNLLDRLVQAEADFNLVHAPFQGTVRPPIGRLHSLYALFRMVDFEKQAGLPSEKHEQLIFDTIRSFQDFELTDFAKRLVQSIQMRTGTKQNYRIVYA